MTATMRAALKYLSEQPEQAGCLYVHRNTRKALERRGWAVAMGSGLFGITTLGLRAVTR